MKRILQIAALALLVILGGAWRNTAKAQVGVDISYQSFYDELSPYGEWVDYPDYGYVWVPAEGPDFQPYRTNGHWVWSEEYDWIWVSDYSWGWAAFHYGRWFYDPLYGWMWVPGYEWSPAWVAWRDGGDYYGWAPLRPGISIGISIGTYNPPIDYWCFAPRRYISSPSIYNYYIDRSRNVTIINNTTIINNYNRRNNVFVSGPNRRDAERYAGRINPVRFRESSRPGRTQLRRNEISVYRPRVQQDNNRQYSPRNFERYDRNRSQNNGTASGRSRDNNPNRNGNNLPQRRDNNEVRQRDNNNNNEGNNRFGRGNRQGRNNEQPGRTFERPGQQTNPQQPGDRTEPRRNIFQRRNSDNPGTGRAERPQQQQPRQFERPQQQQPRQMERPAPQQPRQMERRQQQQPRQMERPQQQPRQFESRRSGNENRGGGNSGGNSAGRERGGRRR